MEQRIKDRIDEAYKIIIEREIKHNQKWEVFVDEWYTNEIREMLKTITDFTCRKFGIRFGEEGRGYIYLDQSQIQLTLDANHVPCRVDTIEPIKEYRDYTITNLESHANKIARCETVLGMLQEDMPQIIEAIADKYKEITEAQTDKLDKIFETLDIEEKPMKHIKVTVEWL